MKKTPFLLIFFISINLIMFAQEDKNIRFFNDGNKYYASGKYDDAIENYEKIINSGFESPELYFNIANSYYRSNKFTYSIYYYEKAKILLPGDNEIEHNLEKAELKIQDKIQKIPEFVLIRVIKNIINSESVSFWAYTSLTAFILSLLAIILFLFSKIRKVKKISFLLGILIFMFSLTTFVFARVQYSNLMANNTAIIFTHSVWVKSSPVEDASDLFNIHEGLKVRIEEESNDWYEIKLSDGKDGWVKKEVLKII